MVPLTGVKLERLTIWGAPTESALTGRRKDLSMAARPFWQGYMKLSLVTCPVAMMSATSEEEKVRFHVLNRRTGNRIQSHYVDAETGKPVDEANEVRGYA